ncbi:MAG: esterase-like activity of phytase family protein [Roseobacter sp.]
MRRRFTVPLIAAVGLAPWVWFLPAAPPPNLPARVSAIFDVPRDAEWLGGMSGIDVTTDGSKFTVVTDRGHIAKGQLVRDQGVLVNVNFDAHQPLVDRFGEIGDYGYTDAEGVALAPTGSVYVSFEHAHRVLAYDTWDSVARWPSYTRAWRALANNRGLEALARAEDGTLYAIPEQVNIGAWEALVYRRAPGGDWHQALTLPLDRGFAPVGADFGPDGKFYVLERKLYPFGFLSRVRSMTVGPNSMSDVQTVLETTLGTHGNLEGLAVWQDPAGLRRLTMVSDNNFHWFMRNQVVEYTLDNRVALPAQ